MPTLAPNRESRTTILIEVFVDDQISHVNTKPVMGLVLPFLGIFILSGVFLSLTLWPIKLSLSYSF